MIAFISAFAVLLMCSGCVSTTMPGPDRPAHTPGRPGSVTGGQFEAEMIETEMRMLQEQSEEIIAEVHERKSKGEDQIREGDELTIEVWMRDRKMQFAGFPLQRYVPASGKLFIPNIGLTTIAGKTDDELKVLLSEHFDKILRDATVVVEHRVKLVTDGGAQRITAIRHVAVMGWIASPGLYAFESGLTIRDVIAHAGGPKEFANTRKVFVVSGDIHDPQVFRVNINKILTGKDMSQNIVLHPNDAVYIPPIGMWRTYDIIRKALLPLTAVRDAVWIAGGV